MSTYNRQINIAKIVSQAGVDAETAAEILSTDPEWAAEIVAAYDADFASHVRQQAFRRLGPPAPAVRLEWAVAKLAA